MHKSYKKKILLVFLLFLLYSIIVFFFVDKFSQKINPYSTIFHYFINLAKTTCFFFPIVVFVIVLLPGKVWSKFIVKVEQINNKRFLLVISLIALLFLSVIAWFVYEGVPKGDAVNVFFQTKIFAHGKLYAPLPEFPDFFHVASMIRHEGKWFAMLPPGHALILVPFYLLHSGWLTGPLLGVLSLIILFLICYQYYDEQTAKLAVILAVFSPYFLLMQASFLPHASGLLFGLLLFLFYLKALASHRSLDYFFAGSAAGLLFLIRPYTGIAFIFPFIIYSLYLLLKRKVAVKNLLLLGFGMSIFCLLAIFYNRILTGDFFTFPYNLHRVEGYNRIGFGATVGAETFGMAGHNPIKAMINLGYNFFVTSMHLHGTLFLSLLPMLIFIWKGKKRREDYLLIAVIGSLLLFHFFYWFHGVNPMGSRYYFETIFAMLILNARGIIFLSRKMANWLTTNQINYHSQKNFYLSKLVIIIITFNAIIYLPQCFTFFKTSGWGETRKIYEQVKNIDSNTLIFIKSPEVTTPVSKNVNMFIYGSGFNFNDPWLNGKHLFVHWLDEKHNQQLKIHYPNRIPYLVTFDENSQRYLLRPY